MFDSMALKCRMKKKTYTHTERVFVHQFCTALCAVWHSSRKGEKYLIYKFVDILKLPIWCYCSKSYKNTTSVCVCASVYSILHGTHSDATGSVYSTVKSVYSLRISLVSVSSLSDSRIYTCASVCIHSAAFRHERRTRRANDDLCSCYAFWTELYWTSNEHTIIKPNPKI